MSSNNNNNNNTSSDLRRRRGDSASTANLANKQNQNQQQQQHDTHFAEPLMTKQNTEAYVANAMMMSSPNNHHQQNNNNNYYYDSSRGSTPPSAQAGNFDDSGDNFVLPVAHSAQSLTGSGKLGAAGMQNQILPDLSDCIFTPERVNAHTLMNKWVTVDETRNFALLRKEKRAVVTFQCRIVVKGAKHIQFQVACGPSIEFLMPSWMLVRYIQSELLPPCIFEDYKLVETWMRSFIPEMKSLSEKATNMILGEDNSGGGNNNSNNNNNNEQELLHSPQMTRHIVHAAASVVNSTDLFLALISAAKENAANGGVAGEAGIGLMHVSGGQVYHDPNRLTKKSKRTRRQHQNNISPNGNDSDGDVHGSETSSSSDGDGEIIHALIQEEMKSGSNNNKGGAVASPSSMTPPLTPSTSPQTAQKTGMFGNLRNYLANRNSNKENGQNTNNKNDKNNNNNNGEELDPAALLADPSLLSPEQRLLLQQVSLYTLIPAAIRNGAPSPRVDGIKATVSWVWAVIHGLATSVRREELRARFILPRPTTREQFQARDVLREQVKKNRTHCAMVVGLLYLLICRYVSFDLFLIVAAISIYGVRYLFTEYKNIFINLTKRTARSRVNRVKDWFAFTVRRKAVNVQNNNNNKDGGQKEEVVDDTTAPAPDFDLEEWDFF